MSKPFYAAMALIAFCFVSTTQADNTTGTGNELIKMCNTENYKARNSLWEICVGYIDGVVDELAAVAYELAPDKDSKLPPDVNAYFDRASKALLSAVCQPSNSTREQAALVVSKYLMDHPEKLNWGSANLVIEAESDAWPCGK